MQWNWFWLTVFSAENCIQWRQRPIPLHQVIQDGCSARSHSFDFKVFPVPITSANFFGMSLTQTHHSCQVHSVAHFFGLAICSGGTSRKQFERNFIWSLNHPAVLQPFLCTITKDRPRPKGSWPGGTFILRFIIMNPFSQNVLLNWHRVGRVVTELSAGHVGIDFLERTANQTPHLPMANLDVTLLDPSESPWRYDRKSTQTNIAFLLVRAVGAWERRAKVLLFEEGAVKFSLSCRPSGTTNGREREKTQEEGDEREREREREESEKERDRER